MHITKLVCLLLLAGCASHPLGPEWLPLEEIRQLPGTPAGVAFTVGPVIRVGNLGRWLKKHPQGPARDAVLHHEREHSRRQIAYGTVSWVARYKTDEAFAWQEEQLGWYQQLQHWKARNVRPDLEQVAHNLVGYPDFEVTYAEAYSWVSAVWSGAWHP